VRERNPLILDGHLTGVAVPVSALRSTESCGIGEFLDLPELASWAASVGLNLIQILPVNDTGATSSPYSAVSSCALHPIYLRLQRLPGAVSLASDIEGFRAAQEPRARVDFERVLSFKLWILRRLFDGGNHDSATLREWIMANPWVRQYAVYKCLKDRHEDRSWIDWSVARDPSPDDIEKLWGDFGDDALFYAWIQYHLDAQLLEASAGIEAAGVFLKGDIPILMSVDSTDVWAHRNYFDLSFRAGAPPDMFATLGQSWGFPTYNWGALESADFDWWKQRLKIASSYYHAFRIDHVLGFFRIWSVPSAENSAVLGRYRPAIPLTRDEIAEPLEDERLFYRLTKAWTAAKDLPEGLINSHDRYFDRAEEEDLVLKVQWDSESAIHSLDEDRETKSFLLECHRDRTFLEEGEGFAPAWFWNRSKGYVSSTEVVATHIESLVDRFETRSSPAWMESGRRLLSFVKGCTSMLPCAEDLGVVPKGLPAVLEDLEILSLKSERWEVDGDGRIVDPEDFPYLSVSTPGVHDTSTLRGWWEETDWDRALFAEDLGLDECPQWLTPQVARAVLDRSMTSNSAIRVFQIQDLFSLTLDLRSATPDEDRINRPGTTGNENWSYRIPISLSYLFSHEINAELRSLTGASRGRMDS